MNKKEELNSHFEKAKRLSNKGQHKEAHISFTKALQLNPHESRVYRAWGECSQSIDKKSIKYKCGLAINPQDSLSYIWWAEALQSEGKIEEAEEVYRQGLSNLGDENILLHLVAFLYKNGKLDDLIELNRIEGEKRPGRTVYSHNLGYFLLNKGEYQEAIMQFQKTLQMNSRHTLSILNWSLALFHLNQLDKAAEKFEEAKKASFQQFYPSTREGFMDAYVKDLDIIENLLKKTKDEVQREHLEKRRNGINFMLDKLKFF